MPVTKELLNDYLFRRFNRILPLYYCALLITVITGLVTHKMGTIDFSLFNFIGNAFFLQISESYKGYWFGPYGSNGPLWSLSFEMFYYLFFPLFIWIMKKTFQKNFSSPSTPGYILCIVFLFSLFCIVINKIIFIPYIAFATLFYVWFLGFFLADLYLKNELAFNRNVAIVTILSLITYLLQFFQSSTSVTMLFSGSVIASILYLLYLIRKKISLRAVLAFETSFNFIFYKVGQGSYALYLLHFPLILLFLHYQITNWWVIILSMMALSSFCIIVEAKFVKTKFYFLRIRYFR